MHDMRSLLLDTHGRGCPVWGIRMSTSDLQLERISKVYPGGVRAVDELDLTIEQGEFFAILGPSGCGKTTTLRMIAGLEQPSTGRIRIGGSDVTKMQAHHRNVGVVFQSYALFPHLTVFQNIAFGLTMRGWQKRQIAERVAELLAMIRLPDIAARMVDQLSGGQQQRVALARALAPQPSVLLLDEPLSNLDLKLRQEMRLEIRRIQRELGTTTIFVTHDQGEALALSDRVLVMNDGRISQMGTPTEVYEAPRDRWVASFLGDANIFTGTVSRSPDHLSVLAPDEGTAHFVIAGLEADNERVAVAIRPEAITIASADGVADRGAADTHFGRIDNFAYVGPATRYVVRVEGLGDRDVLVDTPTAGTVWREGHAVALTFPRDRWIVLEDA
jgi:spermidine/putrescine ABC transporter ATP-binding subunit